MGRASDRSDATCAPIEALPASKARDSADALRLQRLILCAVQSGLYLDDPWRHAFLHGRWLGR